MARMTEEEAWALDELVTRTDITLGPNGSDWLTQRNARIKDIDDISTARPHIKAETEHTATEVIIGKLVREKIAASA
ncbi:MAG: hypothetical protein LBG72_08670 [Spirochaetaceae bacterium]|jgi:hypothetical protein|nr:hypothetical protein [Spirochaetaceae bacterium]